MKNRKWIAGMLCLLILLGMAGCGAPAEKATGNSASSDYIAREDGELKAEAAPIDFDVPQQAACFFYDCRYSGGFADYFLIARNGELSGA